MVRYSCYQSIIVHIGERWMADSCTPISFHRDSVIRREMKRSNDNLIRFIAFQYFPLKSYHYNKVNLNKNNQKSRQSKNNNNNNNANNTYFPCIIGNKNLLKIK